MLFQQFICSFTHSGAQSQTERGDNEGGGEACSYQLNVELPHHLHLQVDNVSVTGVPAAETHQRQL